MRLFLSSQDFGRHADEAARLVGDNKKAAFIKNAQDDNPPEVRNFSLPEKKAMFEEVGLQFEEIDLRDYFGKAKELEQKLSDFGSIWCAGGNTFILRRAMKASGLDEILVRWLEQDKLLYGGWSAGSCVAAPSLKGIDRGDRPEPSAAPEEYPIKETIWDGLNLVPFMTVPHCDSDWFKDDAAASIKYLDEHDIEYIAINDGEVIVVDGDKQEILR